VDLERLRDAVEAAGDRWRLLLVAALLDGPLMFGELERAVPTISPAVLSSRLKELEAAGLVVATPYQHRPVRYRYELTARGLGLRDALLALAAWGGDEVTHAACGTPVDLQWWCPACETTVQDPATEGLQRL
jgi:DNA-binding HxlR family transcriptional regulator